MIIYSLTFLLKLVPCQYNLSWNEANAGLNGSHINGCMAYTLNVAMDKKASDKENIQRKAQKYAPS